MFPKKYITLEPTAKDGILRNISFLERELFPRKLSQNLTERTMLKTEFKGIKDCSCIITYIFIMFISYFFPGAKAYVPILSSQKLCIVNWIQRQQLIFRSVVQI